MKEENALIYLPDIGGISYLLPILKMFSKEKWYKNSLKLVHSESFNYIKDKEIKDFETIKGESELESDSWKKILKENKINFVLTTLSSPKKDKTNSNLLEACNTINISSFGFLDHWKGIDRLINEAGREHYNPHYMGVIDDVTEQEVRKYPLQFKNIFVTGHPVLEQRQLSKVSYRLDNERKRIILISQPQLINLSFKSLFSIKPNNMKTLVEEIFSIISMKDNQFDLAYRPHPKEEIDDSLPSEIYIETGNKEYILNSYDYFIGFDSMLLLEASIAKKICISLNFGKVKEYYSDKIPFKYSYSASSINELKEIIDNKPIPIDTFRDYSSSIKRCKEAIDYSLNQVLK